MATLDLYSFTERVQYTFVRGSSVDALVLWNKNIGVSIPFVDLQF